MIVKHESGKGSETEHDITVIPLRRFKLPGSNSRCPFPGLGLRENQGTAQTVPDPVQDLLPYTLNLLLSFLGGVEGQWLGPFYVYV